MDSLQKIRTLFASDDPAALRAGIALARDEIARTGSGESHPVFELLCSLLPVDPFDRPDLVPVVDEALDVLAGLGPSVVPKLIARLDAGDLKAQIAVAHALGRLGAAAVDPLILAYRAASGDERRAFALYALGKVDSPDVVRALPLAVEAAHAHDLELRDTATRALGKMAERVPPGGIAEHVRLAVLERLRQNLADANPGVRAKAAHSLGKLVVHLTIAERAELRSLYERLLGRDERFEWDNAFIVRREAELALARI